MAGTVLSLLSVVVALLSLLGGPIAAHLAVRVGLATVTTKLDDIARRLDRIENSRDADGKRISALEALAAAYEARIRALEKQVAQLVGDSHPPSSD